MRNKVHKKLFCLDYKSGMLRRCFKGRGDFYPDFTRGLTRL